MNTANKDLTRLFEELCGRMSHAEVLEFMRSAIRATILERGVAVPPEVSILIDDTRGEVILISGTQMWDEAWNEIATESATKALQTLALKVGSTPAPVTAARSDTQPAKHVVPQKWKTYFFWGFNGIVLFYWTGWFVNFIFSSSFREWYDAASTSTDFGIQGILLLLVLPAIPLAAVVAALLARRGILEDYSHERTLMRFEIPALIVAFVMNVTLSSMPLTDALRVLLMIVYLLSLAYWYLIACRFPARSFSSALFRHITGSITATSVAYLALLIVVPIYLASLEEIVPDLFDNLGELLKNPMVAMGFLAIAIAYLIPIGLLWILGKSILKTYRSAKEQFAVHSPVLARAILPSIPVLFVILLFAASWQFSSEKYTEQLILLSRDDSGYAGQAARARELVDNKDDVDEALRSALYARRQYLFSESDLSRSYGPEITSAYLRIVAFPFVYNDSDDGVYGGGYGGYGRNESYNTLAKGYMRAFGEDISSVNTRTVEIRKLVELLSRDIHVLTSGSPVFATVTVTDSLSSFMPQDQEAVYEFSLPEDAVVTGLKLGPSLEFAGVIAPRGAAQQTYINQVRQTRDPALLEQVGPRQYRLRVYPIPGISERAEQIRREKVEGPTQRVQFTYMVARQQEGIPLPVYSNEFNLLKDGAVVTAQIDGRPSKIGVSNAFVADEKGKNTLCALKSGTTVQMPGGGESRFIFAGERKTGAPVMSLCDDEDKIPELLQGQKIAILVDTSYKNRDGVAESLLKQVRSLPTEFFTRNSVQYFPFSESLGAGQEIKKAGDLPKAGDVVYFGKGNIVTALRSIDQGFTSIIILSGADMTFDEATPAPVKNGVLGARLVFVHPDGKIPSYTTKFSSLTAPALSVQVVTDIRDALPQLATEIEAGMVTPLVGSYWYIESPKPVVYGAFAASWNPLSYSGDKQTLFAMVEHANTTELMRPYGNSSDPATLAAFDILHARAKNIGIVTPISSYIALVNDAQRNMLNSLSGHQDRYTNEQTFAVVQPTFASPMSMGLGGGFGGSSLGLSGSVTTTNAPSMAMMDGGGGNFAPTGPLGNSLGSERKAYYNSGAPGSDTDAGMLWPRIALLVAVLLMLGGGVLVAYRLLRRAHG